MKYTELIIADYCNCYAHSRFRIHCEVHSTIEEAAAAFEKSVIEKDSWAVHYLDKHVVDVIWNGVSIRHLVQSHGWQTFGS